MVNIRPALRRSVAHAFLCALLCASAARASERTNGGPLLEPSTNYAAFVLAEVSDAVHFRSRVEIYRAPVDAARAVYLDGHQAIVYNPAFLTDVAAESGTPWAAVSVIAHEIGHHYYGHSRQMLDRLSESVIRQRELDADYFSGFALARMGASLEEAEAAQQTFYDEEETPTHPGSETRLRAIEAGWLDGHDGRQIAGHPSVRIREASAPIAALSSSFAPSPLTFPSGNW
jgi:hypothetical protein